MKIKKIIIIADILRHKSGQDGNADMFYGLLSGIIGRISDIPVSCFDKNQLLTLQKDVYLAYGFDILKNEEESSIFGGVPVEMWEALCFAEPNNKLLEIIKTYFQDSLVICREPSLIFKKVFKQLNIPFIELAIHSARYLDDLILGITSNLDSIYNKLKTYEMNSEYFYFYADLLKAESYRRYSCTYNPIDNHSAIFFAQTPIDRSLLDFENNKIVNFFDYQKDFEEVCSKYNTVYYKSHPHFRNEEVIKYLEKFDNVKIMDDTYNTYDLLSSPNIKLCFAISSGTINEAKFFGKETKSLLCQPYEYSDEIADKNSLDKNKHYISVHKDFLTSYFWADILSDLIPVKMPPKVDMSTISNKLRRIIGSSWGYIDNDSQYIELIQKLEQVKNEKAFKNIGEQVNNTKFLVERKIPRLFFKQLFKK